MNTPLENPVDEIRRIKADLAAADGYDLATMSASLRKLEAELRAQGRVFADSTTNPPPQISESLILREEPPRP